MGEETMVIMRGFGECALGGLSGVGERPGERGRAERRPPPILLDDDLPSLSFDGIRIIDFNRSTFHHRRRSLLLPVLVLMVVIMKNGVVERHERYGGVPCAGDPTDVLRRGRRCLR